MAISQIVSDSIAANTVSSSLIANGSILSAHVANGAITSAHITSVANTAITGVINSSQIATSAQYMGFKNRIINGDMRIDQRNAGANVTPTADGTYTLDRFQTSLSAASKFSVQQNAGSVTPPSGFINYLGVTSLSAYTVGSADYFGISQKIEGLNAADLGWGTANAQTVTLSFWVRSSLTGTFGGSFRNNGTTRSYPFSYTISSANTWTQISITVAGDTSGTWLTTNGIGIQINFSLGTGTTYSGTAGSWFGSNYASATGATSVVGTSGATFYITGVQLEVGSSATGFDYVDYGTQLAMCQRYYVGNNTYYFTQGYDSSYTTLNSGGLAWTYQMRTTPTVTILSGGADGHHGIAPTVRVGPTYYGVGLQFTGSALRTNANCSASVGLTLSAEL